MKRNDVRAAFGRHLSAFLSDRVKIIWENLPAGDTAGASAWLRLSLQFQADEAPQLLYQPHRIHTGQLSGSLSVATGSGTSHLDSLLDELDQLLSCRHLDVLTTGRLQHFAPYRTVPYHSVDWAVSFVSYHEEPR